MKLFYWNESFETGIESIDNQHKVLVELLNKLSIAVSTCQNLPDIDELLQQLREYTMFHFRDEEELIAKSGLSPAQQSDHKAQHTKFISQLDAIEIIDSNYSADTLNEILEFLTTWLVSHILGSDMQIMKSMSVADLGDKAPVNKIARLDIEISHIERTLLQALNESERRFRFLTDHTPALIWASDANHQRIFANASWFDYVGLPIQGGNFDWLPFVHPEDQEDYQGFLTRNYREKTADEIEYRLKSHNGSYHYFLEKMIPRIHEDGTFFGFIASAIDITQLKNAEKILRQSRDELEREVEQRTAEIHQLVVKDELTGIGNRRFLDSRFDGELATANRYNMPLTMMFIDIDHFKRINDHCGHDVGDQILIEVVNLIAYSLRDCDALARFGGEEFVALLPNTDISAAKLVTRRIMEQCRHLSFEQIDWPITLSIGLAQHREGETKASLLSRCDQAMYQAKRTGRDRYIIAD